MTGATATEAREGRVAAASGRRASLRRRLSRVALYTTLTVLGCVFLVPFYVIVRNSLMDNDEITSYGWRWVPARAHWENFSGLFSGSEALMGTGLENSAIVAASTFVFSTLFSSMAGYALARIPFRRRNAVFLLIICSLMVPSAVTFVPTFVVVAFLGGVNTLWGIIVPGLFSAFSTFLFRQFYLDFPEEMEDAGRIDGLGYWGVYRHLLLPNSKGIIMALGILSFITSWNAFLWPLIIGLSQSQWTVQIVLSTYLTSQTIDLGKLFAAAVLGVAPLVIVFLLMQRYIVEGVKLSGQK